MYVCINISTLFNFLDVYDITHAHTHTPIPTHRKTHTHTHYLFNTSQICKNKVTTMKHKKQWTTFLTLKLHLNENDNPYPIKKTRQSNLAFQIKSGLILIWNWIKAGKSEKTHQILLSVSVSLPNGISTFVGYLISQSSVKKNNSVTFNL